jgi:Zn-dependent peptidase ImmA (M78 family)
MSLQPIALDSNQINATAEGFLNTHHPVLSLPIPIEEIIDNKLGIDVIPIEDLKDSFGRIGLKIDAFITADFKSITVDKYIYNNVATRYRFTLAHEIGHMYLHGYLYKNLKFTNRYDWAKIIQSMPLDERSVIEWQADEFAGLILAPKSLLKKEFEDALEKVKGILSNSNKDFITDMAIESILAPKFLVSKYVINIRAERDKLK